ncbi:hypothetical protein GUITHDRAFT_115985 [Guillardia theta CCMP2712]|uniref:Prephenate/arogenate dehydrogenase domain-containing protein n=1 Tax=Guillardia theta (strain CCMP2712) TaxID=905079 RepID=L1IPV3_GUITC|nr:hypothetical protein GUITHDRAFT_115985 [Guillardia theta CCMP2712]EKX37845.1 hypothetical protein GUITHDRAFT_115985 [Guillardia theta CCMP2712]|eukprot:XP_005824825.1 hypothetical protein GUITHDRAFT_115985 [Guillardia theta CCMP2712]
MKEMVMEFEHYVSNFIVDLLSLFLYPVASLLARTLIAHLRSDACFNDYLSADPCDPKDAVIERVRSASVIISCLPPGPCVRALEALAPHMASGALFTDVLSVKSGICSAYSELKDKYPHIELLSVHPMFAPAAGWQGQNTVSIHIRTAGRSKAFEALIESWGSTIVPMESGELHDRVTSAVQNATHAALITFGLTLKKMGYDAGLAKKISTPPHRAMIAVIQRMASINEPDTYWDIQTENPDAFCNIIADFKPLLEAANAESSCESPY